MPKLKNKERILKAARKSLRLHMVRITSDLLAQTLKARKA
jgi:hypothetical protein